MFLCLNLILIPSVFYMKFPVGECPSVIPSSSLSTRGTISTELILHQVRTDGTSVPYSSSMAIFNPNQSLVCEVTFGFRRKYADRNQKRPKSLNKHIETVLNFHKKAVQAMQGATFCQITSTVFFITETDLTLKIFFLQSSHDKFQTIS